MRASPRIGIGWLVAVLAAALLAAQALWAGERGLPAAQGVDAEIAQLNALAWDKPALALKDAVQRVEQAPQQDKTCWMVTLAHLDQRRAQGQLGKQWLSDLELRSDAAARVASLLLRNLQDDHLDLKRLRGRQALELLDNQSCLSTHFIVHNSLAQISEDAGHLDDAVQHGIQAINLSDALQDRFSQAISRSNLAWTYRVLGQPDSALEVNRIAIKLAEETGSPGLLSNVYNAQGFILSGSKVAQSAGAAEAAVATALAHAKRASDPTQYALMVINSADLHLRAGRFDQAEATAQEGLKLAISAQDKRLQELAQTNLGLAHIMQGRVQEGLGEYLIALEATKSSGQHGVYVDQMLELGSYLERAGEQALALKYYLQARNLADQLQRDTQRTFLAQVQAEYERSERLRTLRLLDEEYRLKAAQLEAEALKGRTWFAALIAACLALGVMTLLMRRTRRVNAQLADVNAALHDQSQRDPLTGLPNRRRLTTLLAQQPLEELLGGCLMLLDLDHFKHINDTWGHGAGDAVLAEVAHRLNALVHPLDVIIRWGGEEFLIVSKIQGTEDATALAQRILNGLAHPPVRYEGRGLQITGSIGFACFPSSSKWLLPSWERAVDLVDAALYLAKAHGRNQAYGIADVKLSSADDWAQCAQGLEQAAQAGRLSLIQAQGPAVGTALDPGAPS